MPFVPIQPHAGQRTDWTTITHIRLVEGKQPDTKAALARWKILSTLADADGVMPLYVVFSAINPERNRGGHEAAIRADLRCYSNPTKHGNNSQNKGWIELSHMA